MRNGVAAGGWAAFPLTLSRCQCVSQIPPWHRNGNHTWQLDVFEADIVESRQQRSTMENNPAFLPLASLICCIRYSWDGPGLNTLSVFGVCDGFLRFLWGLWIPQSYTMSLWSLLVLLFDITHLNNGNEEYVRQCALIKKCVYKR